MKSSLYSHTYLTETSFPCSGIGEQDHDVGQLVGGHAVHGGGRQAAAVTVGGGRGGVGGVFKLLRIDLVCVGERGGLFGGGGGGGGGGRPAFVFNSGRWSSEWVQDGGGGRGGLWCDGGGGGGLGGGGLQQRQARRALERDAQQLFAVVGNCEPR